MTSRRVFRSNQGQRLYNEVLSAAMSIGGDLWDPDDALRQDPDAYHKILNDAKVRACITKRQQAVARRKWTVAPAGDSEPEKLRAAFEQACLQEWAQFGKARYRLAAAPFEGSTYELIEGERRRVHIPGHGPMNLWCPTRSRNISKRRMIQEALPDGSMIWKLWSPQRRVWEPLKAGFARFLVSWVHDDVEETLGYGRGLFEVLYCEVYVKTALRKIRVRGAGRFGLGQRTVGIDMEARGDQSFQDIATAYQDNWGKSDAEHVLPHDKRDDLNLLEGSGTGWQMIREGIEYADQNISVLILGGTAMQDSVGSGSFGKAEAASVDQTSQDDIIAADSDELAEAIGASVLPIIERENARELDDLGLLGVRSGTFTLAPEPRYEPKEQIEIFERLQRIGFPTKMTDAAERFGLTPARDGEERLEAPAQATSPGPFSLPPPVVA